MESTRIWFTTNKILEEHSKLPIRQIYLWFITADKKIAIVGKGEKWQFPGGKPEAGETNMETLAREVYEEAGIAGKAIQTYDPYTFTDKEAKWIVVPVLVELDQYDNINSNEHDELRWVTLDEMRLIPELSADAQFMKNIL